jgi:hypothetical protein
LQEYQEFLGVLIPGARAVEASGIAFIGNNADHTMRRRKLSPGYEPAPVTNSLGAADENNCGSSFALAQTARQVRI